MNPKNHDTYRLCPGCNSTVADDAERTTYRVIAMRDPGEDITVQRKLRMVHIACLATLRGETNAE